MFFFLRIFLCTGQAMMTAIFVIVEVFILLKNSFYYYYYYYLKIQILTPAKLILNDSKRK